MMTAANKNVSLLEALRQMGVDRDADFLRDGARLLAQSLIELEATEMIGADRYERTPERCRDSAGDGESTDTGCGSSCDCDGEETGCGLSCGRDNEDEGR